MTALAFGLCALVGPAVGVPAAALAFLMVCLLQDLAPGLMAQVPLAMPPDRHGPWEAAIVLTAVAVAAQARTLGASDLAQRLVRNEV